MLFSLGSEEPGNKFKSSVIKNADPSNLKRSLLEGNKDHLLNQAKGLKLSRHEHQVGSLNTIRPEINSDRLRFFFELFSRFEFDFPAFFF